MKKLVMITIPGCPYCAHAKEAIAALKQEAAYKDVEVEEVSEVLTPELAKPYGHDYYYVPSIFLDKEKLFEAKPGMSYEVIYDAVKAAFERVKA